MQVCLRRWLLGALAPALLVCGVNVSYGQIEPLPAEPTIEQRFADQEAKIQELESRLNQGALQAQPVSAMTNLADAAKPDLGACKEVELITKPAVKVFGRLLFDHIMFDDPVLAGLDRETETGFNTVRIGANGYVYENVFFQVEVEFEGKETDFKDTFIEAQYLPLLGRVRAGHFKEPFSLEEMTSSRFTTFMNRSIAHSALVPSRNFGVMAYDYWCKNEDISWMAGVFRGDSPDAPDARTVLGTGNNVTDSGRAAYIEDFGDVCLTGRVAWNPYYDELSEGRYLTHIGVAGSYRNTARKNGSVTFGSTAANDGIVFQGRGELGTQGTLVDTRVDNDFDWVLLGLEFAVNWDADSVQAEFYYADTGAHQFNGGYVQLGHFLTCGDTRGYKRESKAFERVKPFEDAFRVSTADGICCGRGAWEMVGRYSWLDLNEGTAGNRGYVNSYTVGMNWYWNPYTRMMFDYVYEDVNRVALANNANGNLYGLRWQIDY